MLGKTKKELFNIYSKIPDFPCKQCAHCCNHIIWFKPENEIIREYIKNFNLQKTIEINIQQDDKEKCPFLKNNKCLVYPVRPIVCRFQGNISELPCKMYEKKKILSKKQVLKIKQEFNSFIKENGGYGIFYSSRKIKL